jgi:hypothetical protein
MISPYIGSLFEFRRIAYSDSPFTPAREGSSDVFLRIAYVAYGEVETWIDNDI